MARSSERSRSKDETINSAKSTTRRRSVKIVDVKVSLKKLRKYHGRCFYNNGKCTIYIDSDTKTHDLFLSTLLHEFVHLLLYLIDDLRTTSLLGNKNSKVVLISRKKVKEKEEQICTKVEEYFLKLFRKYLL